MDYKYEIVNNYLFIKTIGSIDSSNAGRVEERVNQIINEFANDNLEGLVVDAEELDYISSAGLRIVLKLMRKLKKFEIVNTSKEVYDIFDMTGFTKMISVTKAYRKINVNDCPVIGEGANGIVYQYNADTIVKVYKKKDVLPIIQRERELSKKAFILGIPTAISYDVVKVGDTYGTMFELINAKSMSVMIQKHPENIDKYSKEYAELVKLINSIEADVSDLNNAINTIYRWLGNTKDLFKQSEYDKIKALVDGLKSPHTLIHGDLHTNNVMMQSGELLLIDMDTLAYGNPIIELAIIDFTYNTINDVDINNSKNFLGIDPEQTRKFYECFINNYFEGHSKEEIEFLTGKIELLSLLRVASHMMKRGMHKNELEQTKNRILALSALYDDLNL